MNDPHEPTEEDDIFERDPFDPESVAAVEDRKYEALQTQDERVSAHVRRCKEAYTRLFANADADDVDFVMRDLMWFCHGQSSTFHPTNQKLQDHREGRRSVYLRITEFTKMSHDALLQRYYKT